MQLTPKQVRALLKIITNNSAQPILSKAVIKDNRLFASNQYVLAAIKLDDDISNRVIDRKQFKVWLALAERRDRLDEAALMEMPYEDISAYKEINYQSIINTWEPRDQASVCFNPDYLVTMHNLIGGGLMPPTVTFGVGATAPMLKIIAPKGTLEGVFIIMQIKRVNQ
jgi:hypothetical protein